MTRFSRGVSSLKQARLALSYGTLGAVAFKQYKPEHAHKVKVGHIDYKDAGHLQESGEDFVKLVMASSNLQALWRSSNDRNVGPPR